jgi:uncharacterized protein (DUF2062 family)
MSRTALDPSPPRAQTFWQRRVILPIVAQLRQGFTPEKIALTIAIGVVLGVFPILGATTLLCAAAGIALKLNQPIIQLVNYFVYPLQLVLLIPFYRAGESIFGREHIPLSIPLLFERFSADVVQFLQDFGMVALLGITVWCLVAPAVVALLYLATRSPLRALGGVKSADHQPAC